ncbi:HAD family hydrolase [Hamadaea tsunoensis]|uniref:HAD family hydrolase n=1 Tax=Hamadaea tsunoensis TaxID=53368 RepID=UPI00040C10B3|nr:HAD hydrolase family protein [Hamadaea tsunoensis]
MDLAVVDLDGTLLRSDATVSERTRAALAAARAAGMRIVVATARPPRFLPVLIAGAGLGGLAVCCNGAVLHDMDTGVTEVLAALPSDVARAAAETMAAIAPDMAFAVETGTRALAGPGWRRGARRDPARLDVRTVEELWDAEQCVKLLGWTGGEVTTAALERWRAALGLSVTYSGAAGMVEIAAAGVSKAATVRALCERWGVTADRVVAFGDMPNDLPVLEWAGLSVAVANAHPEVRERADLVTASNDEDGVALVLERLAASRAVPDGTVVPAA